MKSRLLFCVIVFSLYSLNVLSSACLTDLQLIKLQSVKVADREKYLSRANYYRVASGTGENESGKLFEYSLDYAVSTYRCSDYPNAEIDFYESTGSPLFMVYKVNYSCWYELQGSLSSKTVKEINTSSYSGKDFKEGNLTFSFRNYSDYSSLSYCVVIYNTLVINAEIQDLKIIEEKKKAELQAIQDEYYSLIRKGDSLQNNAEYFDAVTFYERALNIFDDDVARNRIQQCKVAECNSLIREADQAFDQGNYLTAIEWYSKAKQCPSNVAKANSKISECESRILKSRIQEIKKRADSHFEAKRYFQARDSYNSLLDIEPDNLHAKARVKEINELEAFLIERKSKTYNYESSNQQGFNLLRDELVGHLNQTMQKNSDGQLVYDFTVEFDTSGYNLTTHSITKSTFRDYNSFLDKTHKFHALTPISTKGYFVNAQSKISISSNWKTSRVEYHSKNKNSKFLNTTANYPEIRGYVDRQVIDKGLFTFDVKQKTFNGKNYTDVYMVDYKTKSGPVYSMLSLLYPGVGSLKVSHGEKGWSRLIWFTFFGASTYALHSASKNYYDGYLNATSQSQMNSNYVRANILHKSALVCGGFAATFYIYDFFWAFGRGCKNEVKARALKRSKEQPIEVIYQSVK